MECEFRGHKLQRETLEDERGIVQHHRLADCEPLHRHILDERVGVLLRGVRREHVPREWELGPGVGHADGTTNVNAVVNVLANRHAISPYIYGGAFPPDTGAISDTGTTVLRWGGNAHRYITGSYLQTTLTMTIISRISLFAGLAVLLQALRARTAIRRGSSLR